MHLLYANPVSLPKYMLLFLLLLLLLVFICKRCISFSGLLPSWTHSSSPPSIWLAANLRMRQPGGRSPPKCYVLWNRSALGDKLMHTCREIWLLIVLHITLLTLIVHYSAALPVPGPKGRGVETCFRIYQHFKCLALYLSYFPSLLKLVPSFCMCVTLLQDTASELFCLLPLPRLLPYPGVFCVVNISNYNF